MVRMGRPPKRSPQDRDVLVQLTQTNPTSTLRELQAALAHEAGGKASTRTSSYAGKCAQTVS